MTKRIKLILGVLLLTPLLYGLVGFLVFPPLALYIINQQLAERATLPSTLEQIEFNPFSLELSLYGLRIGNSGAEQIQFDRLYVNLQLDSLWTGVLHLESISLDKAKTDLLINKKGSFNLVHLFKWPKNKPDQTNASTGELFPVRIDHIRFVDGHLHFKDLRQRSPVELIYDTVNVELHNLSTLPEENAEVKLVATDPGSGRIDWQGQLNVASLRSNGQIKISDVKLKALWPYVREALPLELNKGVCNLAFDYQVNKGKRLQLQLNNVNVSVAPMVIQSADKHSLLTITRLAVSESSVDLEKQQVSIGKLHGQGVEVWVSRDKNGDIDWQKIFVNNAKDEAPINGNNAQAKPWKVILRDAQLRGNQLHLTDLAQQEPVALEIGPLNVDVAEFDSVGTKPFTLRLDTGLGGQGLLMAEGQWYLSPFSARLRVTGKEIDLSVANTYLKPYVHLDLRSATLGSDLAVDLKNLQPLAFSLVGKAEINQFHSLDTLKNSDFIKWQHLQIEGLNYQHGEILAIDNINIEQPYARFVINEDLTTNLNEIVIKPAAAPDSEAKPAIEPEPPAKPLAIRVGGITVNNGSANFADFSLTPNFATAIQQISGQISHFENQPSVLAGVDIQGKVDRHSPVTIKGSLYPFDPLEKLDIATQFKHVELTTLTPYSGKFAGYRIRKGKLNLDLHYRIDKGQLNADNTLVLEHLQLGDRVDSPDAVDLPVRLAVALLKDSEGKIAVDLPIKGDLNNPQFKIAPVLWKTVRTLVLRVAKSPFNFIAGLVGGSADTDLSTVKFAAGSEHLDNDAQAVLKKLANALNERPTLQLEIEGISNPHLDGPLLAALRLEREYQNRFYQILKTRGEKLPVETSSLIIPVAEKTPLLDGIFQSRFKKSPPAEWNSLAPEVRAAKLQKAILDSWAKSPLLLRQLAQVRAAEIKDYLVYQCRLPDDRLFLLDVGISVEAKEGNRVATALHLASD